MTTPALPSTSLLPMALSASVSLLIFELRELAGSARSRRIQEWTSAGAVDQLAGTEAPSLMFGVGKGQRGEAARTFNALAKALAAMAFCPGGVTFAGQFWCDTHRPGGGSAEWPCQGCVEEAPADPPPASQRPITTLAVAGGRL